MSNETSNKKTTIVDDIEDEAYTGLIKPAIAVGCGLAVAYGATKGFDISPIAETVKDIPSCLDNAKIVDDFAASTIVKAGFMIAVAKSGYEAAKSWVTEKSDNTKDKVVAAAKATKAWGAMAVGCAATLISGKVPADEVLLVTTAALAIASTTKGVDAGDKENEASLALAVQKANNDRMNSR